MCKPHQTFRNVHAHELPREGTEARDARTGFRRLSLWREQRRSGRRRLRHRLVMSRSQQRKAPLRCAGQAEEHTSELQSLMRISYAVFCLKKKKKLTP